MQPDRPSLVRILLNDYAAFLAAIAPPLLWALYAFVRYTGFVPSRRGTVDDPEKAAAIFFWMAVTVTLVLVPLCVLRVRSTIELLTSGASVAGTITGIWFFRDRGRVEYTYEHAGKTYRGGRAIMKNRATQALAEGQEVALAVDPNEPRRALIRRLYTA